MRTAGPAAPWMIVRLWGSLLGIADAGCDLKVSTASTQVLTPLPASAQRFTVKNR